MKIVERAEGSVIEIDESAVEAVLATKQAKPEPAQTTEKSAKASPKPKTTKAKSAEEPKQ